MKKISITPFFTTPNSYFELSVAYLDLLGKQIEENILAKYEFKNTKSEELEIYLDTKSQIVSVITEKVSKTNRGKYLTYRLLVPNTKFDKEETHQINLNLLTEDIFIGLSAIFSGFDIPQNRMDSVKENVLCELNACPQKYILHLDNKQLNYRLKKKALLEEFRQKRGIH